MIQCGSIKNATTFSYILFRPKTILHYVIPIDKIFISMCYRSLNKDEYAIVKTNRAIGDINNK